MAIEIENISEEMGEETVLGNNDDGTLCSKIVGSTNQVATENSEDEDEFGAHQNTESNENTGTEKKNQSKSEDLDEDNNVDPAVEGREKEVESEAKAEIEIEDEFIEDEFIEDEFIEDRDFDKNPTVLYALVQKKLWKETIARAKKNPGEARAFICRREKDGRVRWRLLPLHAAIVFKAPEDVVETLLTAFPKASEAKDDQGMLPLHLAFRNGASESAVNLLLLAYPQSVDIPDRKGRVPLTLAKAATSPNREIYIKALEKGPSHYAVSALACARARITAEQNAMFEAKLLQARASQECILSEFETEAKNKRKEVEDKLVEKETELAKLNETSQVLVDHVTSLEAQINTRCDTERFLATKIAKLEEKLKESDDHKNEKEKFLATKISKLEDDIKENERLMNEKVEEFSQEKKCLLNKIDNAETALSSTREKLAYSSDTLSKKEKEWASTEKKMDGMYRETEVEWANAQANCAILEAQLKKKIENEHLFASQVSSLASRLAECSHEMNEYKRTHKEELQELRDDRSALKETVEYLTKRLQNVNAVLKNTHQEQMIIVDDAIGHEENMANCMEIHAKMVSESIQQEKILKQSRDEMMKMLVQSYDEAEEKRRKLMDNITLQGKHLSSMIKTRGSMLTCVQNVTTNITSVLQSGLADDEKDVKESEKKIGKEQLVLLPQKPSEKEKTPLSEEKMEEDEAHASPPPKLSDKEETSSLPEEDVEEVEQLKPESNKKIVHMQTTEEVNKIKNDISNEERSEFEEPRNILSDGRITAE